MQPVVNPLPPVVLVLALAIIGVELVLSLGTRGIMGGAEGVGWRLQAIREFGFFAPLLEHIVQERDWTTPEMLRFVTYPFVHLGLIHATFVVVFLLALGKLVGETFGNLAVLATFFLSAVFGALIFAGLTGDPRPLVGGYPAVYGLIGAYTFLLWTSYGATGDNQWRAFTLIGVLLTLQLVFGAIFGSTSDWVAEVAGFLVGFALAPVLAPGGITRLLRRLRQR